MPLVCNVLRGRKLQDTYSVRLIEERKRSNVKRDSSTNEYIFKLRK